MGGDNTAIGYGALAGNTVGSSNTGVGLFADVSTGGSWNVAMGPIAMLNNTTGEGNVGAGKAALHHNTAGNFNVGIGQEALFFNGTGSANTAIGREALSGNATGSNNTAIGYGANVFEGGLTNATAVGYGAVADASNKVRIGNTAVTVIGGQVAWTAFSDKRAKKDIQDLDLGLDFINALRPVAYRMKDGNDAIDMGFIAQDIEELRGTARGRL